VIHLVSKMARDNHDAMKEPPHLIYFGVKADQSGSRILHPPSVQTVGEFSRNQGTTYNRPEHHTVLYYPDNNRSPRSYSEINRSYTDNNRSPRSEWSGNSYASDNSLSSENSRLEDNGSMDHDRWSPRSRFSPPPSSRAEVHYQSLSAFSSIKPSGVPVVGYHMFENPRVSSTEIGTPSYQDSEAGLRGSHELDRSPFRSTNSPPRSFSVITTTGTPTQNSSSSFFSSADRDRYRSAGSTPALDNLERGEPSITGVPEQSEVPSTGKTNTRKIIRRKRRTYVYNPKPLMQKQQMRKVPNELKDAEYWEQRRKNNEAAKISRINRRQKEMEYLKELKELRTAKDVLVKNTEELLAHNKQLEAKLRRHMHTCASDNDSGKELLQQNSLLIEKLSQPVSVVKA